ncbi:CYFIP-related Rac1 interactor B isoform X3 [Gallus gallus]|uniref:CYFIP-related Rac1 interactor B isoform X3 n=1 Tax=Gallus gallus TaxID=9031 RepID=UPI001AE1260F|nr:CYFIP-related Rac1 interactor B isoform X3 [Gallus gallus]
MRSVLAAGRACAVTCWLPPLPPRSSPPVHPGHRTPARLAGPLWCFAARPLPLLPPPLSAGGSGAVAIRPCPARGPVRPGPAQGGGGSGSVRIAGRLDSEDKLLHRLSGEEEFSVKTARRYYQLSGGQEQSAALAVDAQPTESEKEIYNQVNVVLKDAEGILEDLQSYRGAGHEIREAIQHPNDEKLQEKAWGAVVPLVGKLKKFYEFSQRLEAGLRGLLGALTSTPYSPTQHLEREQALAKQFAEILHFTLRFDELKMTNPAIQNDFSYYRRTLSRMRINNVPAEGENEVNNELANRMSLFYAEATPMLKTLSDATTKFVSENKNLPIENTTDCLSTMASVCRVMLETPEYRSRFTNEETVSFCLRVMVGVIILYDHVHPVGAFAKTSKIDMKGCIKVLKDQPPNSVEGLLNALRYTTKHLNDETTSKQIKSMLQ